MKFTAIFLISATILQLISATQLVPNPWCVCGTFYKVKPCVLSMAKSKLGSIINKEIALKQAFLNKIDAMDTCDPAPCAAPAPPPCQALAPAPAPCADTEDFKQAFLDKLGQYVSPCAAAEPAPCSLPKPCPLLMPKPRLISLPKPCPVSLPKPCPIFIQKPAPQCPVNCGCSSCLRRIEKPAPQCPVNCGCPSCSGF